MTHSLSLVHRLSDIDAAQWDALTEGHPFMQHAYLLALEQAECAVAETGWAPHYLLLMRDGRPAGAMPLYLKSHSRGEYVFDYSWAHAFAEHGLRYYPKLLGAVPFTPVPGPRLLARSHADRVLLAQSAAALAHDNALSSVHVLFPSAADRPALREAGFMFRENVQFHWFNHGYSSFDDFIARMNQKNRKKIRQDRNKVAQAGVRFRWIEGEGIDDGALRFFFSCYCRTYLEHGNPPYLNLAFFRALRETMPDRLVLVVAEQHGRPIASAFNIRDASTLYGRYWGTLRFVPGLHFETCYTQAIEFCIRRGIAVFQGGAQGEHKLSRGLEPVETWSAHWVSDRRYAEAIGRYLQQETPAVDDYVDALRRHSPFRKG